MMKRALITMLALMMSLGCARVSRAAPSTQPQRLTAAILDFDANLPARPDLGKQIAESLSASMAQSNRNVTFVERATLARALAETELNLTGLTDPATATKVGHLVGAKLLITGRAFLLDKQLNVTGKIIGVETGLVETVAVKGDEKQEIAPLVEQLSAALSARLRDAGPKLMARDAPPDGRVAALAAKLSKSKLPIVAVRIDERHVGAPAIDPAVQTEVTMLLKQAGFKVVEGEDTDLAREKVEMVIRGEAFSEFAARIGNLVSCSSRIEVKIVPLAGGEILFTDRETTRATDLSQNLAGKLALQKGGREIGIRVLEYLAKATSASPQ